mmetsp:Transcript_118212/g.271248  ORF Transcript_118212/g.271248 Transcript_118212/m.271248 type:complete len:433 (-) Transcript_118212:22-1320(-)
MSKAVVFCGEPCEGTNGPFLEHDQELSVGSITLRCIGCPCHTKGSFCFYVHQPGHTPVLFTGDTLFLGGCGACFEGNNTQMLRNFARILRTCDPETLVFPGHEYTTMLAASNAGGLQEAVANGVQSPQRLFDFWSFLSRAQHRRSLKEPIPTVPLRLRDEVRFNPMFRQLHSLKRGLQALVLAAHKGRGPVRVVVQAGSPELAWRGEEVLEVGDGTARQAGVQPGWRLRAVNGAMCGVVYFEKLAATGEPFVVDFDTAPLPAEPAEETEVKTSPVPRLVVWTPKDCDAFAAPLELGPSQTPEQDKPASPLSPEGLAELLPILTKPKSKNVDVEALKAMVPGPELDQVLLHRLPGQELPVRDLQEALEFEDPTSSRKSTSSWGQFFSSVSLFFNSRLPVPLLCHGTHWPGECHLCGGGTDQFSNLKTPLLGQE